MKVTTIRLRFVWLALAALLRLAAAESTPFHGTPFAVPGRIQAEDFDLGGEGVAYHGLGAVVTAIHLGPGGPVTNDYPPIPRVRADADMGMFQSAFSPDTNKYLAMRAGEWTRYSLTVTNSGYYTVQLRVRGPKHVSGNAAGDCLPRSSDHTAYDRIRLEIDGLPLADFTTWTSNLATPRLWLDVGAHNLKLTATEVADVIPQALDAHGFHWVPDEWSDLYTFLADWIQLVPSSNFLQSLPLAGGGCGFADGSTEHALFTQPRLIGESPAGELIVQDNGNRSFRLVNRDGLTRTLAGHPTNGPVAGLGAGAGFAPIVDALVTEDQTLWVLQLEDTGTNILSRVSPDGQVTILFRGIAIVPLANRGLVNPQLPTNLPVTLNRLERDAGTVVVMADYQDQDNFLCHGFIIPLAIAKTARFQISGSGEAQISSVSNSVSLTAPSPGYHVEGSTLFLHDEGGFRQPLLEGVTSVLQTADGRLWGSTDCRVVALVPSPDLSLLTILPSPDGRVDGDPGHPVTGEEGVTLVATGTRRFWAFTHWSDGNTENPRVLRMSHDTQLTAHFAMKVPDGAGIHRGSFVYYEPGEIRFALGGPEDPAEAPYNYLVEYSENLRTWARLYDGIPVKAGGRLLILSTFFTSGRYFRATLLPY